MFPGSDTGLTCSEASPTRSFQGLEITGRVFPGSDTGLTCSEASPTRSPVSDGLPACR